MPSWHGKKWTRRRLLQTAPAALVPFLIPDILRAGTAPEKPPAFSKFVDVAAAAGLTHTMLYGNPDHNTYIVEVNGAGCAIFDFDNDGWMDALILGGRTLDATPAGSGN